MSDQQLSLVPILVELPAYGYSLTVNLPPSESSNVLAIKEAISLTCPGNPRVDGQRIIWRGRVLRDEEKIGDLWPAGVDGMKKIVHLSVHPSAWTGKPPSKEESTKKEKGKAKEAEVVQPPPVVSSPPPTVPMTSTTSSVSSALPEYLVSRHRQAFSTLTHSPFIPAEADRESAVHFVNAHGYIWPPILDKEFPKEDSGHGLRYEKVFIDRPYLRLLNPTESPTPAQVHAFQVLSYTIELLKLPPLEPTRTQTSSPVGNTSHARTQADPRTTPVQVPAHLNALLQQMGFPPINHDLPPGVVQILQQPQVPQAGQFDLNQLLNMNGQHINPANPVNRDPEFPQIRIHLINIRPLLLPLFMLSLRTLLLLYFVAPARKPFFMLLILAWVGWEIWGWIGGLAQRAGEQNQGDDLGRGAQVNNGNMGAGGVPAGAGAPVPPPVPQNAQAPAPNGPRAAVPGINNAPGAAAGGPPSIIDTLASFDIAEGETALSSFLPENDLREPGLSRKALSLFVLLIATVHPAIWNRRRALLRAREGRVKVEMNALTEAAQGAAAAAEAGDVAGDFNNDGTFAFENARRAAHHAEMSARFMRRPSWVRRYMQRVVRGEVEGAWVDEMD
ncbi:hypothetical protein C8R42DRAFT_27215 [Lentinula raphanica]|nr:hypothetical protein C8R42DRAFT_27215 [Lentinula raphanica]